MVRRCQIWINGYRGFLIGGVLTPVSNPPEEFREKYRCVFSGSQITHAIDTYLDKIVPMVEDDARETKIELIWC